MVTTLWNLLIHISVQPLPEQPMDFSFEMTWNEEKSTLNDICVFDRNSEDEFGARTCGWNLILLAKLCFFFLSLWNVCFFRKCFWNRVHRSTDRSEKSEIQREKLNEWTRDDTEIKYRYSVCHLHMCVFIQIIECLSIRLITLQIAFSAIGAVVVVVQATSLDTLAQCALRFTSKHQKRIILTPINFFTAKGRYRYWHSSIAVDAVFRCISTSLSTTNETFWHGEWIDQMLNN